MCNRIDMADGQCSGIFTLQRQRVFSSTDELIHSKEGRKGSDETGENGERTGVYEAASIGPLFRLK